MQGHDVLSHALFVSVWEPSIQQTLLINACSMVSCIPGSSEPARFFDFLNWLRHFIVWDVLLIFALLSDSICTGSLHG